MVIGENALVGLSHYVNRFSLDESLYITSSDIDKSFPCFECSPSDVWGEEAAWGRDKRIARAWWLLGHYVSTESLESVIAQCFSHSGVIDERTSASIDENG